MPTNYIFFAMTIASLSLAAACGPGSTVRSDPGVTQVTQAEVKQRLANRLDEDPNAELCQAVAEELAGGNHDALKPHFDTAAFAERIIAYRPLPQDVVAGLRDHHDEAEFFARFMSPQDSRFLCLGTRSFLDHPHLVIRTWTPTRYDYVLLRLEDEGDRAITDYFVVSGGLYHSERQAYYFDPDIDSAMISGMLEMSYRNEFAAIIAAYQSLPETLQMSPYAFPHFINAVFSVERTGSSLYDEATERIEPIYGDRNYTVAYWRMIDAHRRQDTTTVRHYRGMLLELLDDYELLD
ncbi:MAG: hypothetical protein ACNA8W_19085 [Bradymonadaceae bacterium]